MFHMKNYAPNLSNVIIFRKLIAKISLQNRVLLCRQQFIRWWICSLATSYGGNSGQTHQATTWTNADLSPLRSSDNYPVAIIWRRFQNRYFSHQLQKSSFKMTYLKLHFNRPGANQLTSWYTNLGHVLPQRRSRSVLYLRDRHLKDKRNVT